MVVALLASFVAKENSVATLGILFGSAGATLGTAGSEAAGLNAALAGVLTPEAALAFLVVQMLFIPCAATVAAIRQETRSWGWTAFSVTLLLVISLVGGIAAYHVAGW
jgi:ferrous iron transport protein B